MLMALNGELGWVCLMCCNSDSECFETRFILNPEPAANSYAFVVLFSAIVVQWISSWDNTDPGGKSGASVNASSRNHNSKGPGASGRAYRLSTTGVEAKKVDSNDSAFPNDTLSAKAMVGDAADISRRARDGSLEASSTTFYEDGNKSASSIEDQPINGPDGRSATPSG